MFWITQKEIQLFSLYLFFIDLSTNDVLFGYAPRASTTLSMTIARLSLLEVQLPR